MFMIWVVVEHTPYHHLASVTSSAVLQSEKRGPIGDEYVTVQQPLEHHDDVSQNVVPSNKGMGACAGEEYQRL